MLNFYLRLLEGCFKDETSNDCREIYKNARARIGPLETTNLFARFLFVIAMFADVCM